MLPGIPVLAAVAFWLSKRADSHRETVVLPFLSPLVTLIAFYCVGSTYPFRTHPVDSVVISFDLREHWPAFVQMVDQVVPVVVLAAWCSASIVTVGLIAVPAIISFLASTAQRQAALLICVSYVLLSCIFLVIVKTIQHLPVEFRYLLQIYPFTIIGAGIAADLLLSRQRFYSRVLGFLVICLLSTAAVRSTRAITLGLVGHESQQSASCVSRLAILHDLRQVSAVESFSSILTNIQGLAWYAMRIPTIPLSLSTLANASSGTTIIFVRPEYTCSVAESEDFGEVALTRAPDVTIISNTGVLIIGKKR
jgi:hypothetical protein